MSMTVPTPAPAPEASTMPTMAVIFGITLMATGLFAYQNPLLFGTGKLITNNGQVVVQDDTVFREPPAEHAPTSLAPAAVGLILLAAGIISIMSPGASKHAMHAAAAASFLGSVGGFIPVMMRHNDVAEAAVMVGWIMSVCSLLFLALCNNSFRVVRNNAVA